MCTDILSYHNSRRTSITLNESLGSPALSRQDDIKPKSHRWELIPDDEGRMHLMDMSSYVHSVDPHFDAVTDTIFILFTRRNPTSGQVITPTLASIQSSFFDRNHPTRFTVHGWNGSPQSRVNWLVAEEYFRYGDYNMITVDWTAGGTTLNYITARNRVRAVGGVIANFIDFLHENSYLEFEKLHVMGHSLGGQIAGLTGKQVRRGVIQVISAFDPAGPLFSLDNPNERIAPTDGVYVESIITNGGLLGFMEPISHATFYPNFGRVQPGCESDITGQCSHSRSTLLYAESINSMFTGQECSSFEEIRDGSCNPTGRTGRLGGPQGSIGQRGNFFMETNAVEPFSRG
ncbi:CLUMA_CG007552, isoform A [Clunio marinus]|uniref:CLUMA_CG007552, isoform A n=1 Tax=Clunio marinus TaxID=568069 RepID=A0A1J1I356_9DIPT|nr:CLUMA_CG007552, isoform A [Clunio marinus]